MGNSVYISSNLTAIQLEFMKLLDDYEIDIFRFDDIEEQIDKKFPNLNEVLENLVHKKLLSRIERGKFCRFNFRNEFVIGSFIANQGAVGYWSALNLHGLTEQFSNTVFIQTPYKKKDKNIYGIDYKFVKISPTKRAGIIKQGYGNHSYAITDIEKTLIDCFDLPHYSGGYAELIRAFASAKLSGNKMTEYSRKIKNHAVIKRMGFLAELLEKKNMKSFIHFAKDQLTQTYNLIDPLSEDTGKYNAEWKLKLNITETEIIDIVNKQY